MFRRTVILLTILLSISGAFAFTCGDVRSSSDEIYLITVSGEWPEACDPQVDDCICDPGLEGIDEDGKADMSVYLQDPDSDIFLDPDYPDLTPQPSLFCDALNSLDLNSCSFVLPMWLTEGELNDVNEAGYKIHKLQIANTHIVGEVWTDINLPTTSYVPFARSTTSSLYLLDFLDVTVNAGLNLPNLEFLSDTVVGDSLYFGDTDSGIFLAPDYSSFNILENFIVTKDNVTIGETNILDVTTVSDKIYITNEFGVSNCIYSENGGMIYEFGC